MELPAVGWAGAVVLTNALTELVKRVLPENYSRYLPLGVEALGFGLGMLAGLGWWASLFVGLCAMGLYRGAKVVVKGE